MYTHQIQKDTMIQKKNFKQHFHFPNASIWDKKLCNDCLNCRFNKSISYQRKTAEKQYFKGQNFNIFHRLSFDTEGPKSLEENSFIMVFVNEFTLFCSHKPRRTLTMNTLHFKIIGYQKKGYQKSL